MLSMNILYCGALILCWTPLCIALHVPRGQELIQDPTVTGVHHPVKSTETGGGLEQIRNAPTQTVSRHIPHHHAPCFVDDIFASLREGLGNDGKLANSSLTAFGICASSDPLSRSLLVEFAQETSRIRRNRLAYPTEVLVTEEGGSEMIKLTFDLPQSPLLEAQAALLLVLESPVTGGNLDVTFTSQSLQPDTQFVCVSGETQYILLHGKASQTNIHQKWAISAETRSPHTKQNLKDILIGGKSGSIGSMTSLLLFGGDRGTNTRNTHASDSSPASSQTFSFLCELKRLLGDLLPQNQPESPPLPLDSLQSLSPLKIGLSSSETLLAGLINSTALTVFSFTGWRSTFPQVHHGELSVSPALLEELRQRLQQTVAQIHDLIREEDIGDRAAGRLRRLKELSAFPKKKPVPGERQYRAFLLVKALQTVAHTYELQRGLRATRADAGSSVRGSGCGIRNLTVSLEMYLVGPNTANIKNCQGSCVPPLDNINNHAVLLYSHIGRGAVDERAPCCVPVAYEALEVVDFDSEGTYVSIKQDMVAKECGCR